MACRRWNSGVRRGAAARRLAAFAAGVWLCAALAACGTGDDCAGFISINASPEECQRLAQRFGCSGFDVEGPSCGLLGCASCGDLDDES